MSIDMTRLFSGVLDPQHRDALQGDGVRLIGKRVLFYYGSVIEGSYPRYIGQRKCFAAAYHGVWFPEEDVRDVVEVRRWAQGRGCQTGGGTGQ